MDVGAPTAFVHAELLKVEERAGSKVLVLCSPQVLHSLQTNAVLMPVVSTTKDGVVGGCQRKHIQNVFQNPDTWE